MKKIFFTFFLVSSFFLTALFLPLGVSEAQKLSVDSQVAGLWQSILNFFGLGDESGDNQDSESYEVEPLKADELLSNSLGSETDYSSSEASSYLSAGDFTESGNILCLPAVKYKNEPAIIAYKCPDAGDLLSSSFGATDDSGVLIRNSLNTEEYIDCKAGSSGSTQRFTCSVSEIDPQILEFTISPVKPALGQKVYLKVSTKDMKSCFVSNRDSSVSQKGLNFEFNFINNYKSDSFLLTCLDASGMESKQIISF